MNTSVLTKFYEEPPVDMGEILRYMGCRKEEGQILSLAKDCLSEALPKLEYKICYRQFAIHVEPCKTDLSFMVSYSKDLCGNLEGCTRVVLFAATCGIEIDRLISKYGSISPAKALCFQAIGAERIESLCNTFNEQIRRSFSEQGLLTKPRFSPGYGDFPLEAQKDMFSVLDCYRKIGLSLNDSLLMSPSKSVTAIIGLAPINSPAHKKVSSENAKGAQEKCALCTYTNCSFRR